MPEQFLLGIDAGTSVIKAALFDRNLTLHAVTSQRTTIRSPQPGWSEADPLEFWEKTCVVIRRVLAQAGVTGAQIAAVGITGNMVGAWLIDRNGAPVRDAILWNDGRAQSITDHLTAQDPQFLSRIFESSGSVMQQGCTLPIVRWLADHEPETLARAAHVLTCKDWLRYKLTGAVFTDPTEASVMPGDIRARRYNEALFTLLGVQQWRSLWPQIAPSEQVCGEVTRAASGETGLAPGTPVVGGMGDVPASILGAGASALGTACVILGTTCLSCLSLDAPNFTPRDIGLNFALPGAGWARVMANIAGTTNLDWFAAQFYSHERAAAENEDAFFALLESEAAQSQPGANGLLYLPYLSEAGVIAPFVSPGARAQFSGLHPGHTRRDMLRAVYEGVALAIRDCFTAMNAPVVDLQLIGGGAKSPLWGQMIADCCGVRVTVPAGSEFGARGAALLAGVGAGWLSNTASLEAVTPHHTYTPDPTHIYDDVYLRYCKVRNQFG